MKFLHSKKETFAIIWKWVILMTPLWTTSVEGRLRFPFHFSITIPSYRRVWEPLLAWAVPESESLLDSAVPGQTGLRKRYRLFAHQHINRPKRLTEPGIRKRFWPFFSNTIWPLHLPHFSLAGSFADNGSWYRQDLPSEWMAGTWSPFFGNERRGQHPKHSLINPR